MNTSILADINQGLQTAYIDSSINSSLAYRPEFISNDYRRGKKVLTTIEQELLHCDEFSISVAFITLGGITPLLQVLKELENRNIPGKILTTDYLMFSDPRALKKLQELKNIQLRMYHTTDEGGGFHTKGYIFRRDMIYSIIIGSSNMTKDAVTRNWEWNAKIISTQEGAVAKDVLQEFDALWNASQTKDYADFIEEYETKYRLIKEQRRLAKLDPIVSFEQYTLKPNKMQVAFINSIKKLLQENVDRALLISATGTGKTYASAFALREINPHRALFIVHREQIARQAMQSYRKVFGGKKKYALLTGGSKNFAEIQQADLVFATMQMLAKDEVLGHFTDDYFDVICEDECHHVGANSYQKIMAYFRPEFWLGMTASPETNQFDIYSIFDHNIAYEIRLQQALEEDLLCTFHYFGITDLEIDGESFDDETGIRNFSRLVCDERVNYIIKQAEYYGYSGERVKGLIFCSRKAEAKELSHKFNMRGYRTAVLTGEDNEQRREAIIERLVQEGTDSQLDDSLDYIFSVDIFSEGIDIPEVNQVIMLRPTQSPVVFIQQLGRGLRKARDKEYVVILDFIGNYKNNFMIPIALSGDRSYNKDNIRRYVLEGERVIPGSSTIHFDEISKKRIFAAIDTANFSDIKLIKENYRNLKFKLGRIPALQDFDKYGQMDVCRIFDNNSLGSYYKFLVKYEKEYKIRLSSKEEKVIEFISKKLANGKRIYELELLNRMLEYRHGLLARLQKSLENKYGLNLEENKKNSIIKVMTNEFPAGTGKKTYAECIFLEKDTNGEYRTSDSLAEMLDNPDFYNILKELVEFGVSRYQTYYEQHYQDTDFVLYQKYTYEDACRLLNWENNEVPLNIGGYKYDRKTKTFPVFINYVKEEDISDTTKYEDHFVSNDTLIAISKSGRSLQSEDVQNFLHAGERGIDVQLFVRKNKDDKISKEFYYLGRMRASGKADEFVMENTNKTAVEIEWKLETPVREDIYEYITD